MPIKSFSDCLKSFYRIYENYISVDAISALSETGRSRDIIGQFLEAYIIINDKHKSIEEKQAVLIALAIKVKQYTKANESHKVKLHFSQQIFDIQYEQKTNNKVKNSFERFLNAMKAYKRHREMLGEDEITALYIKSNTSYQKAYFNQPIQGFDSYIKSIASNKDMTMVNVAMLKQSLMEFNNALSHLHSSYKGKNPEVNIDRAVKHIERGALDFYKAIIRDLWSLGKIKDIDRIKSIRIKEYNNIGASQDRFSITEEYVKVTKDLLTKLQIENKK